MEMSCEPGSINRRASAVSRVEIARKTFSATRTIAALSFAIAADCARAVVVNTPHTASVKQLRTTNSAYFCGSTFGVRTFVLSECSRSTPTRTLGELSGIIWCTESRSTSCAVRRYYAKPHIKPRSCTGCIEWQLQAAKYPKAVRTQTCYRGIDCIRRYCSHCVCRPHGAKRCSHRCCVRTTPSSNRVQAPSSIAKLRVHSWALGMAG